MWPTGLSTPRATKSSPDEALRGWPLFAFDRAPRRDDPDGAPQPTGAPTATVLADPLICCAQCGHPITSRSQRIEVEGGHQHCFRNPHGLVFEIGCFGQAPGCRVLGEPTAAYSWFPGYAWSMALCGRCAAHLGWRYDGMHQSVFYGLILERLREEPSEGQIRGSG